MVQERVADKPLVLIADDDDRVRELVALVLKSDAFDIIQARDGGEAWQLVKQYQPVVAVLDWEMPVYTGLELTAVIKGDPRLEHITIIMLTARAKSSDRASGDEANADFYVTKPFDSSELRRVVDLAVQVAQTRQRPSAA